MRLSGRVRGLTISGTAEGTFSSNHICSLKERPFKVASFPLLGVFRQRPGDPLSGIFSSYPVFKAQPKLWRLPVISGYPRRKQTLPSSSLGGLRLYLSCDF